MAELRFLFHATNGWGLGHVTRTLALARQVRARAPDSRFLFLTNSEASHLIWREGFAAIKTPSFDAVRGGLIEAEAAIPLGRAVAATSFAAFRPHALIVDSFPMGGYYEMSPLVASRAHRILIYRERHRAAREAQAFQGQLGLYHLLLVPHPPGEAVSPAPSGVELRETGHMLIRSRSEAVRRDEARARLGLPQEGFVLFVGFGGGGDDRYAYVLEQVLSHAQRQPDVILAIAVPPLLRIRPSLPADRNVVVVRYYPLAEVMSAFDAAVAGIGFNSVVELLHHGVPTLFLPPPRTDMEDDHMGRARRIREAGAGWVLDSLGDEALTAGLARLADPAARAAASAAGRDMVPRNGAEDAAEFLLSWLEARRARAGKSAPPG